MLNHFTEFRRRLDEVMIQAFGRRIVLYGYGRSGRFIQWYAEYYHSLKIDYIITEDWSSTVPYEFPLFRNTLLDFDYKDVNNAIIWLAMPDFKEAVSLLEAHGLIKNQSYYNLCEMIYGEDCFAQEDKGESIFLKRKSGFRDIQFMEWLEYKYHCNFVTAIEKKEFEGVKQGHSSYMLSADKIIFPILDKCHINFNAGDRNAIFDFGCGKGGALVTFFDYGFMKVGGVEYEEKIFKVLKDNMDKLGLQDEVELLRGDAVAVTKELDVYNWFYFFNPFEEEIYKKVMQNIMDSVVRRKRKVNLIVINPHAHRVIEDCGFILVNQFEVATRQRVVDIFANEI